MKQEINSALFLSMKRMIHKNGWMELPAQGSSMFPLIREGNLCRFHPLHPEMNIGIGDIILYGSSSGHLIAHRLLAAIDREDERLYICKGDTNLGYDEPVRADQMIGVLHSIRKSRKVLRLSDPSAALWTKAIITLPFVSKVLNRYISSKKRGTSEEHQHGQVS